MAEKTKIQWTESTWNPIYAVYEGKRGWHCVHASDGCRNCYAETLNRRIGTGLDYKAQNNKVVSIMLSEKGQSSIDWPLRTQKPHQIFVCSMTDLFADFVPDEFIDRVLHVVDHARQHTFQILTKRPERMSRIVDRKWGLPPPNAWFGVSVEDQKTADERIPYLLDTPAHVRWVSYEPAIGPVDFTPFLNGAHRCDGGGSGYEAGAVIDWIVVGGESGAGARPFEIEWAHSTVRQCRNARVACFVKQLGACPAYDGPGEPLGDPYPPELSYYPIKDKQGGNWDEWPEELRVREWPNSQGA